MTGKRIHVRLPIPEQETLSDEHERATWRGRVAVLSRILLWTFSTVLLSDPFRDRKDSSRDFHTIALHKIKSVPKTTNEYTYPLELIYANPLGYIRRQGNTIILVERFGIRLKRFAMHKYDHVQYTCYDPLQMPIIEKMSSKYDQDSFCRH